jgi:hypothetical protein
MFNLTMPPRFNNLLIYCKRKTTLFTKKEQGSVLVIALGMGLLMTGVASFVLIKANSNKINTVSDQKTKQAVAVTEGAASRYLELITKYPAIAVYCANGGTAPCDTGKNWSNLTVSDLTSASEFCVSSNTITSSDITTINNAKLTGWQTFPGNTQYRLINYTYQHTGTTPNTAPGMATLTLEGRTSSNSSDHRGTTRLEFQIPITANPNTTPCPMPGILAKSDGTIKVSPHSNGSINAVVRRTGSAPPSGDFPSNSLNGTTIYDGTTPPSVGSTTITVPNIPSTVSSPSTPYYTIYSTGNATSGYIDLSGCSIRLPRKVGTNAWGSCPSPITSQFNGVSVTTADQPHPDGRYHYIIPSDGGAGANSLKLSNAAILIDPETGKKVVLYVKGKIEISGTSSNGTSPAVSLTCENTADPSAVPITTFINQGLPENLEMYGPTDTVNIPGSSRINSFMLFPNAEVKVSQGLIAGAVWAKTFDFSNTSGCTVGMIQKSVGGVLAADLTLPPTNKINAVSSWRRVKTEK